MWVHRILISLVFVLTGLTIFLANFLWSDYQRLKIAFSLSSDSSRSVSSANLSHLSRFEQNSASEQNGSGPLSFPPLLKRLSRMPVLSAALSQKGDRIVFIEKNSGKIWTTDWQAKETNLFSETISERTNLLAAFWSSREEILLARQSKGEDVRYAYFQPRENREAAFSPFLTSPVWSPDGQKIAYLFFNRQTGEGQFSLANPDGSLFKNILPTRLSEVKLFWPQENFLSFLNQDNDQQSLFLLDIAQKQLQTLLSHKIGLEALWSPSGQKLIFSSLEKNDYQAYLLGLKDQQTKPLLWSTTASQCAWSLNELFVFCSGREPKTLKAAIFRFNTQTGETVSLFSPSENEPLRLKNPFLSPIEDYLIFVNFFDQYLYRLALSPL